MIWGGRTSANTCEGSGEGEEDNTSGIDVSWFGAGADVASGVLRGDFGGGGWRRRCVDGSTP